MEEGFQLERFLLRHHLWVGPHILGRAQRPEVWWKSEKYIYQFDTNTFINLIQIYIRFGGNLAGSGDLSSAGLCYLFITIPGVFFLQEVILVHIFKGCSPKVNTMAYIASGFLGIGAMAFGFYAQPLIFQYPATILGYSIIGVKVVGVFVHLT